MAAKRKTLSEERDEYEQQKLQACVGQMYATCKEAEQVLTDDSYGSTLDKASRVMHIFAWGWANASSSLETVIAAVQRRQQREEHEQQQAHVAPAPAQEQI